MNTKHFHYFLSVAKFGSMSKAASYLYVSQPAISRAIAELEKQFNTSLFHRNTSPLQLTSQGEVVKKYAIKILEDLENIQNDLSGGTITESLKIGATLTIGNYYLPTLIKSLESCHNISTYAEVQNTERIKKLLLEEQLDFALIEGSINHQNIKTIPLRKDQLSLFVSHSHPLAKKELLTPSDLQDYPFVVREHGSGTRVSFENLMYNHQLRWRLKASCSSFDSIIALTKAGLGIGVFSRLIRYDHSFKDHLVELAIDDLNFTRDFSIAFLKNNHTYKKYFTTIEKLFN